MATYSSIRAANAAATAGYALSAYNSLDGPITTFIDKLGDWKFNFPANHLWTINILLHNDGSEKSHTLANLYTNILKVNALNENQEKSDWSVKSTGSEDFGNDYITKFGIDQTGLFLANGVNYSTNKAQINNNMGDILSPYGGFLGWGSAIGAKTPGTSCNIQFFETNWNIGNILFDKWIAAILQQGLIEDSSLPNIKSDILIYKYAPSLPRDLYNNKSTNSYEWQLKEIVKLYKAVPIGHSGDSELSYSVDTAPKTVTVEFSYQDYSIEYTV